MNEDLLSTLKQQHKDLAAALGEIKNQASQDSVNSDEIVSGLGRFKKLLLAHLDLEDTAFYPELIKKMEAASKNTKKAKEFYDKMKGIAE